MKRERILTIILVLLVVISIYLYSKPIILLIKNYSLAYTKEVYLGGDNIVLDYLTSDEDNSVTAVSEYATIGTLTYIDTNGNFGAVGHNLNYSNFKSGNIFIAPVDSVLRSKDNYIGEKNVNMGYWESNGSISDIKVTGVYGNFTSDLSSKQKLLVGMPREIEKSGALLYTNVGGTEVKAYKIQVERVFYTRSSHNIYVKITDEELLAKTGGIIQGMSGSPIVQNGKIIGSLSHVDDENPQYGYGIFITYMI